MLDEITSKLHNHIDSIIEIPVEEYNVDKHIPLNGKYKISTNLLTKYGLITEDMITGVDLINFTTDEDVDSKVEIDSYIEDNCQFTEINFYSSTVEFKSIFVGLEHQSQEIKDFVRNNIKSIGYSVKNNNVYQEEKIVNLHLEGEDALRVINIQIESIVKTVGTEFIIKLYYKEGVEVNNVLDIEVYGDIKRCIPKIIPSTKEGMMFVLDKNKASSVIVKEFSINHTELSTYVDNIVNDKVDYLNQLADKVIEVLKDFDVLKDDLREQKEEMRNILAKVDKTLDFIKESNESVEVIDSDELYVSKDDFNNLCNSFKELTDNVNNHKCSCKNSQSTMHMEDYINSVAPELNEPTEFSVTIDIKEEEEEALPTPYSDVKGMYDAITNTNVHTFIAPIGGTYQLDNYEYSHIDTVELFVPHHITELPTRLCNPSTKDITLSVSGNAMLSLYGTTYKTLEFSETNLEITTIRNPDGSVLFDVKEY